MWVRIRAANPAVKGCIMGDWVEEQGVYSLFVMTLWTDWFRQAAGGGVNIHKGQSEVQADSFMELKELNQKKIKIRKSR